MPRSYVDNAQNRSLGRVGMTVGSMPVSRGWSGGGGGSSYAAPKTYVDNSYNRSAGRVGMTVGSMVMSRGTGASNSSTNYSLPTEKTYVDNAYNRRMGRDGMPVGSMVISKGSNVSNSSTSRPPPNTYTPSASASAFSFQNVTKPKETKQYVDNPFNRRHNRVGLEHGEAVIRRVNNNPVKLKYGKTVEPKPKPVPNVGGVVKVYKDNKLNQSLGRVGKAVGTAVYNRKTGHISKETYIDNAVNRQYNRVGMPKGCMPIDRKKKTSDTTKETVEAYLKLLTESVCIIKNYFDLLKNFFTNSSIDIKLYVFTFGPFYTNAVFYSS